MNNPVKFPPELHPEPDPWVLVGDDGTCTLIQEMNESGVIMA